MKFRNRVIILSIIGFGMGVTLCQVLATLIGTISAGDGKLHSVSDELIAATGSPLSAFIVQSLVSAFFGVLAMGGSAVYSIEEWSLVRCTAVHYLAVMIGYTVTGVLLHWFTLENLPNYLLIMFFMTLGYIVVWLANYLSYKAQIKEINRELDEYRALEYKEVG